MPGLSQRSRSDQLQFNQRLPPDLVGRVAGHNVVLVFPALGTTPERTIHARLGKTHIRFSLGTTDVGVARQRVGLATAHLENLYAELRRGPQTLSQKQVVALSGEVYRLVVERFDENPGSPDRWAAFKALSRAAREGRIASPPGVTADVPDDRQHVPSLIGTPTTEAVNALPPNSSAAPSALEKRYGVLVDWVLAEKGVVITDETRAALIVAVDAAATDAAWRMKRAAAGDYTPDLKAARFPAWTPPAEQVAQRAAHKSEHSRQETVKGPALSWDKLISTWEKAHAARGGPETTRREWRARVMAFAKWAGVGPASVTADHVRRWRDKRLNDGVSPTTVGDGDLSFIRGIYKLAIDERVFTGANPARDVRVVGMARAARQMKPFTNDEAAAILAAAKTQREAFKRWVPWLCAFTGSRVATMMNLRASDVKLVDGIHVVEVSADAGPVKTRHSERMIPIHQSLIDDGFLEFVASRQGKRLFLEERRRRRGLGEHNPGKHHCDRLAKFVRGLGLGIGREHGKCPNHAWRHWLKRTLRDVDVADTVSDAITGHRPRTEGAAYGGVSLKAMGGALARVSVPRLASAAQLTREAAE